MDTLNWLVDHWMGVLTVVSTVGYAASEIIGSMPQYKSNTTWQIAWVVLKALGQSAGKIKGK